MKKKKSIVLLSLITVFVLIVGIMTFVSFPYPNINLFGKNLGLYDHNAYIDDIKLGIDLKGGVYVVLKAVPEKDENGNNKEDPNEISKKIDSSMELLRNRLTAKGYPEANVYAVGGDQITIEIPDVDNPDEVFKIIGKSAILEFRDPDGKVIIGGKHVKKAVQTYDQEGKPAVGLELDAEGTKLFADATTALKGKTISIFLDEDEISKATVNDAITNGKPVITNLESLESAKNLAWLIESGSLDMKFEQLEPRTISATLGEEAIKWGLIAGCIGVALILIFMGIYYRGFGLISNISLIIYTLLLLIALAIFPWVQLTLPGIAGIILSIGMAVDANIIILERIRDEYRSGKILKASIKSGFKRAFWAIFDSNITTIISAVVLWVLGNGPVRGFAITLFLGIIISMFCSLVVTRWLVKLFLPLSQSEKFYNLKKDETIEKKEMGSDMKEVTDNE